jgi:hypothetical protein
MTRRSVKLGLGAITAVLALGSGPQTGSAVTIAGTSSNFVLIGHNSLFDRGENAAPALFGHYIYVGNRTDGTPQHGVHTGVQVVDIADPANPVVVGQIPLDPTMTAGYTSRELRVWPQQQVLMVLYFGCSALIHDCTSGSDTGEQPLQRINFFDLSGANAAAPLLTSTYKPITTPHEMFLCSASSAALDVAEQRLGAAGRHRHQRLEDGCVQGDLHLHRRDRLHPRAAERVRRAPALAESQP